MPFKPRSFHLRVVRRFAYVADTRTLLGGEVCWCVPVSIQLPLS